MMKKLFIGLCLLGLIGEARAQGTFPLNNIPMGKGPGKTGWTPVAPGPNGDCMTVVAGAWSSAGCLPTSAAGITFLQSGTGAVSQTFDQLYRGKFVTPEMYGALCDGTGDDGPAIMRAMVYAASVGAEVRLSPCTYRHTTPIVDVDGVVVRGQGKFDNSTILLFAPSGAGQIQYRVRKAGTIVSGGGLLNVRLLTLDTVNLITAIEVEDISDYLLQDIWIQGTPGVYYGGANSIGVRNKGREFLRVNRVTSITYRPFLVSENPNNPGASSDFAVYTNIYAIGSSRAGFEIDTGLLNNRMVINGISCPISPYCIYENDTTSTLISQGWTIENVGMEQASSAGGFNIYIKRNAALYGLNIGGFQEWDAIASGLYLRNVIGPSVSNVFYGPSALACIDVDSSVRGLTLHNVVLFNCSTAAFLGQNRVSYTGGTFGTSSFPFSATYASDLDVATLSWITYTPAAACQAGALGGGNSFTGSYKIIDGKTTSVRVRASIGAAGINTCTGLSVTGPFLAKADQAIPARDETTNTSWTGLITAADNRIFINKYDGTNAVNNLIAVLTGNYEIN